MIASATLFTDATLFSGAWAVLPAGGIALVLANQMLNAPSRLKSLLSSRFLVRAGDISYSWYLWHWPLLVMAPVLFPDHPLQVTVAAVALSLVLAELSYRFVEKPFRHHVALRLPTGGVVAAALTGTVATAGALTLTKRDSAGEQLSERQRLLLAAREDRPTLYALGCHVGLTEMHVGECTVGLRDSLHVVVLFGDSHAAHWPFFHSLLSSPSLCRSQQGIIHPFAERQVRALSSALPSPSGLCYRFDAHNETVPRQIAKN